MIKNAIFKDGKALVYTTPVCADIIFDCGQCFRFDRAGGGWRGVAYERLIDVSAQDGLLCISPCTKEDFEALWRAWFDLDFDYEGMERRLCADPVFAQALPYAAGMRVLRQEPFETLISFIISANNNIPRIKKIIAALCAALGRPLGGGYFAFPRPEALAGAEDAVLRACGGGYRVPYIKRTAAAVACGDFDMEALFSMDYEQAKKSLQTLCGVGPKVADCVLLYSVGKREAFPKDVWMRRALHDLYGAECTGERELCAFIEQKFGALGGMAQQYLFHYMRVTADRV